MWELAFAQRTGANAFGHSEKCFAQSFHKHSIFRYQWANKFSPLIRNAFLPSPRSSRGCACYVMCWEPKEKCFSSTISSRLEGKNTGGCLMRALLINACLINCASTTLGKVASLTKKQCTPPPKASSGNGESRLRRRETKLGLQAESSRKLNLIHFTFLHIQGTAGPQNFYKVQIFTDKTLPFCSDQSQSSALSRAISSRTLSCLWPPL